MARNLITGGLGFVGSCLARQLVEDGEEVVVFDVVSALTRLIKDIENRVRIVRGDLTNWAQVLDAVKDGGIDCIYHLGALLTPACEASPSAAYETNLGGTYHVLEAARLFNVSSLIFTSSIATYGPDAPAVVNEDTIQRSTTVYGILKVASEQLGEYYHRRYGVNFRSVRYPLLVGPGRTVGISRYATEMIQVPALGYAYQAYVEESLKMPVMYVEDAAWCLVCLKRASEGSLKRCIYNVGGNFLSARAEADIVRRYLPQAQIEFHPDETAMRLLNDFAREIDDSRARQEWGFSLRYNADDLVKHFISEIQANRALYE
jgi:threonine 3-dehydrogenase